MKCDDIFDPIDGMQTWYGKVAPLLQDTSQGTP